MRMFSQNVTKLFLGGLGGNSDDGNAVRKAEPPFVRGQRAGSSVRRGGGRRCGAVTLLGAFRAPQLSPVLATLVEIPPEFTEHTQNRRDPFLASGCRAGIRLHVFHLDVPVCLILLHSDPTNEFPAPSKALLLSL